MKLTQTHSLPGTEMVRVKRQNRCAVRDREVVLAEQPEERRAPVPTFGEPGISFNDTIKRVQGLEEVLPFNGCLRSLDESICPIPRGTRPKLPKRIGHQFARAWRI